MEQFNNCIKKIESLCELESQIDKEQLILCDDMQNTFFVINLDDTQKVGIGYYDYGVPPGFQYSQNGELLYVGVGRNLLCINIYQSKVLFNEDLQSVFYELLYDWKKNYICVICELDVYCYCLQKQKWKMGFRSIINEYSIIDNNVFILCDDGIEYLFTLEEGKLVV